MVKKIVLALVTSSATWSLMAMGQTTSTWSKVPDPTALHSATPLFVTPKQNVTFTAFDVVDMDTRTDYNSGSCTSTTTLVPDGSGASKWLVADPGVATDYFSGLTVTREVETWTWPGIAEGDYASYTFVNGNFYFDDGRATNDPRRDAKFLGLAFAIKLIPDQITTALDVPMCYFGDHIGHTYAHTLRNRYHPGFSFGGMTLKEKIIWVICDVPDSDLAKDIIDAANGTWTINPDNSFDRTDKHGAGSAISQLMEMGNSTVTLLQVYQITSWGWLGRNPNHCIEQRPGLALDHVHTIVYEYVNASTILAHKDGLVDPGEPCS